MAKQEVGLKIDVDVQSVGNMKQQLRAATQELIAMNEKFGSTSQQAIDAARKVANLKDAIGDAKSLTDAFNPDAKFKAFGQTLGAVAGGFSAVQGAMGLLGSESEDLQKSLLKVQSALALSQGIEQLGDLGQAFKNMKAVAIDAFKGIKAAIGSTGIGLLVLALGSIVAYWDDIKEAVSGVNEEQKKLNEESKKNLKTQQDKLNAISEQDNILKLQGKTEKEIIKDKIKQYDLVIKAAEAQIISDKEIQKQREAAVQRNAEITKNIINGSLQIATLGLRLLAAPIDALILTANKVSKILGFGEITSTTLNEELSGVIKKVTDFSTSFLFDPEKVKADGQKASEESLKNLNKLKNDKAGFELQIKEINKKGVEESTKARIEAEKKLTEFIESENKKRLLSTMSQNEKELFELRKKFQEQYDIAKKYGFDTKQLDEIQFKEGLDLVNKSTAENTKVVIDANAKKLGDFTAMVPKMATLQTTLTVNQQTESDIRKAIDEEELAAKQMMAEQTAGILSNLSNVLGAQTKAGKAAAIAAIVIEQAASISRVISNTAAANAKAVAASPLTGGMPWVALNTVSSALSIASSIANARKSIQQINSNNQNVSGGAEGGKGGGGAAISTSAPVAPTLPAQVEATQVNTAAVNQMGNRAARAYVLNSDIQNDNQRNAYIERNASIG